MRKLASGAALLLLGLAAIGCGSERAEPPDLSRTEPPSGFRQFLSPDGRVRFSHPENWVLVPRKPPGVVTAASGGASVSIWAYRSVAEVSSPDGAEQAKRRLLASLARRDPSFRASASRVTTLDGSPAVEIRGSGPLAGMPVTSRSVHVYKGPMEYVIDAFATPSDFGWVDREVFEKVLRSLQIDPRQ